MHKNILNETYEDWYFQDNQLDTLPMAKLLAPKITKLLGIESILDIGCATGHWLSCYEKEGVKIHGIEGTVNAFNYLLIDSTHITLHDLRNPLAKKYPVDLVTCIEVAEHIEPEYVDIFVNTLTQHKAPRIIMTGAAPEQGGHGHFNCQPKDYWKEKLLKKGYVEDISLHDTICEWCREARETKVTSKEFLRLGGIEGDQTGLPKGTLRASSGWNSHQEALTADFDKLVLKAWDNYYIPFWFPRNLITFTRESNASEED